jgi:hypothetical protein
MKLLIELNNENVKCITEEKEGKKFLRLEGVFMQSGIKNRNGRVYPRHVMENEVNRIRY